MAYILIIEDEEPINRLIKQNLALAGHSCDQEYDGLAAKERLLSDNRYDLVIMDVMLPHIDGFSLMEYTGETPVIFLTAKSRIADKLTGLTSGAWDYLTKPFEMLELLARMENVLKRHGGKEDEEIHIKDVVIYEKKRIVTKGGKEVSMQPMEFDCLMAFWKRRGRVLTRDQILNMLWGVDFDGESRTVDVHVRRLREKIEPSPSAPQFVHTKWGVGYYYA